LGLRVGILPSGPLDAITDVAGVEVGHTTIIRGDDVRTGVTAVVPHPGNLFREKVPGAVLLGNGFGKLAGSTQVDEMGDIETPILPTSTTSVPRVADALISYMLALPGNEDVLSINPLVGETNDGYLSDIRGRHITPEDGVKLQLQLIRNSHRRLARRPRSPGGRYTQWCGNDGYEISSSTLSLLRNLIEKVDRSLQRVLLRPIVRFAMTVDPASGIGFLHGAVVAPSHLCTVGCRLDCRVLQHQAFQRLPTWRRRHCDAKQILLV
jgi:hypothetical protein